jgi:AraC-like DNA-binding protein
MEALLIPIPSARKKEIVSQYLRELDKHIQELKSGLAGNALTIKDFAEKLFVHPVHLSNTIKEVTGSSTCQLYEERLIEISKELLVETSLPIYVIALQLTYDPSNFTKFFKQYTGMTPRQFRRERGG